MTKFSDIFALEVGDVHRSGACLALDHEVILILRADGRLLTVTVSKAVYSPIEKQRHHVHQQE